MGSDRLGRKKGQQRSLKNPRPLDYAPAKLKAATPRRVGRVAMLLAASFVLIQLLHCTLATKQPAMTAPALAAKLKEIGASDDHGAAIEQRRRKASRARGPSSRPATASTPVTLRLRIRAVQRR